MIEQFKSDKCSIDIQQLQFICDYLIKDRDFNENFIDELEDEINKLKDVIDRMSERMNDLQYEIREDCFIPREFSDINDCVKKESCKDCIKEYFMKENK